MTAPQPRNRRARNNAARPRRGRPPRFRMNGTEELKRIENAAKMRAVHAAAQRAERSTP